MDRGGEDSRSGGVALSQFIKTDFLRCMPPIVSIYKFGHCKGPALESIHSATVN